MSKPLIDLEPLTPESAPDESRDALTNAKEKLGFIPNLYARMAHAPGLLQSYLDLNEHFRNRTELSPVEQEVVLLSISAQNECQYCMAAHSFLAENASKVPEDVIDALRDGEKINDDKLEALRSFTQTMVDSRGRPAPDAVNRFREAGYTDRHALEVILAIGFKTMSNYTNHVIDTPVDDAFAEHKWEAAAVA